MKYHFALENGKVTAVPFSYDGKKISHSDMSAYISSTSCEERTADLNAQFLFWAKENNIEPKIDKLPYWAREAFEEDASLIDVQNADPHTLLRWILEYHGIIGFEDVIAETVLSIFGNGEECDG